MDDATPTSQDTTTKPKSSPGIGDCCCRPTSQPGVSGEVCPSLSVCLSVCLSLSQARPVSFSFSLFLSKESVPSSSALLRVFSGSCGKIKLPVLGFIFGLQTYVLGYNLHSCTRVRVSEGKKKNTHTKKKKIKTERKQRERDSIREVWPLAPHRTAPSWVVFFVFSSYKWCFLFGGSVSRVPFHR